MEEGIRSYACSVCGAERAEAIPATGTPSISGNDNLGGGTPTISGNGNSDGGTPTVSGNGDLGGSTPTISGNDNTDVYQTPNASLPGDGNSGYDIYQSTNTAAANTPWTPEPKTGDGISTRLYATTAMILGFTYLLLLFSERHGMTEETKKELLSRLIRWAKYGGRLRRMLALAAIFLLLAYYHSIGKQIPVEEENGLTA